MKRTVITGLIAFSLLSCVTLVGAQTVSPNVTFSDKRQQIVIEAGEGYKPSKTLARADVPTILKVKTSGTLDCSLALAIPAIGFRKTLPITGETLIDVPPQRSGSKLQGVCSMAMYGFEITFQ